MRQFLNNSDWQEFRKEFSTESDRACALLGAAFLDNNLEALLIAAMLDDRKRVEELFQENNTLGSFLTKIKLAYCFNIIPDIAYHDLNLIRKIRNRFAHEIHGLNFKKDPIRGFISNLKVPEDYAEELRDLTHRDKFIASVSIIGLVLETNWYERAIKIKKSLDSFK